MKNLTRKHFKIALLGMSMALAPALSSAAWDCRDIRSMCYESARTCVDNGGDPMECFGEVEHCMFKHGCG